MPSAQVTITQLPQAGPITGTESVPIVQNGQTVQTTTGAIAASPSQNQTFITLNQEPTLPNSRALSAGAGLTLTDGGPLSTLQITLTGAVASLETSTNGLQAKTGSSTLVGRTITGSTGVSVTNGDGVSGNPTIVLTGIIGSLAGLSATGILAINGSNVTSVEILGTANQIGVANGTGPNNPVISIVDNPTIPGTGAMRVPVGTTAERPAGTLGQIRYNSVTGEYEAYTAAGWADLSTTAGVVDIYSNSVLVGIQDGINFIDSASITNAVVNDPVNNWVTVTPSLTNTGVTAGAYGAADKTLTATVDAQGRLTLLSDTSIDIAASQVSSGTFPTDRGGTGLNSYAAGDTVYYATGTALSKLSIGSNGYVMTSTGSAPQWSDPTGITIGTATNVAGGGANQIVYNTAAGTTSFITAPTVANTYLEWSGSAFQWSVNPLGTVTSVSGTGTVSGITLSGTVTTSGNLTLGGSLDLSSPPAIGGTAPNAITGTTITANTQFSGAGTGLTGTASGLSIGGNAATASSATTSTNLDGGAAGSIPYQTAPGVTTFLAQSSGVLVGGTTPSYSTAPSLTGTNFSSIPNGALQNSSITIGTTGIALGSSSLTLAGLTSVTVTQDPSAALDLATKQYVDGLVATGIVYHTPVKYEVPDTTGNLTATYSNGVSGVGATLTNAGAKAAFAPDGPTAQVGDRILIYNQTNQFENGIYEVTTVGSPDPGGTDWVLTRTTDADSYGLNDANSLGEGSTVFVTSGNTGAGETYTCNTSGTITFGSTAITFAQVASSQVYSAGTGLTLTNTQFSLTVPVVTTLGGTGLTSYTTGDMLYYSTGTALSKLGIGASTYLLTSTGSAPQWSDPAGVTVGTATNATTATTATNVTGGAAGSIVYQSGASTTTTLALGTNGYFLIAGATAPQYADPTGLTVGTATNANNVAVASSSVNATFYPTFVDATSGNQAVEVDSDLTYNPSTNTLTAGTMVATTGIFGGTF